MTDGHSVDDGQGTGRRSFIQSAGVAALIGVSTQSVLANDGQSIVYGYGGVRLNGGSGVIKDADGAVRGSNNRQGYGEYGYGGVA